jgi:ribosomal small subunit protein bTHX
MGKGDIKTKRGKIVNKSFGKRRLHKKKKTENERKQQENKKAA